MNGRTTGPLAGNPLFSVEQSIGFLTQSISRLTETLRVLEQARDALKKNSQPPIPDDFNIKDFL
jgi:hypothetical protein